ncbi:MAG: hypothetical protein UX91_C0006G0213 [Candidatus Amesbacteria bacterium GW2011_GWB1_47_19]|nr:MAG: hypothetical protein UW51_C0002G0214 [Candidatus Amesbacteria bacterium GW2011_GWA1_44_24]KKU30993.1 MAG: hypothetical protein UX46_C0008G0013 [Candidatus Amesbacteria bacterium GW2011_GWC1_46_24]KKU67151.1 MAG: hypothetical protein UX91_C0006G0213 [Candidatus Amesbacteria bacterium GW2011_GWB1_47_19]OGD05507.1 MAG: hypothetical protein A2379_00930 [Candidatus Amesbacteria bacterium RIFOXYB1_FULL_47_13]HBC73024.1 hypothetical protein [Candidatus Amesbacteria bacterium]
MKRRNLLNTDSLRSRLKLKNIQSELLLKAHHSPAVALLESAGIRPGGIRDHASRLLAAGATASALFLTPTNSLPILASLPSASQSTFMTPMDLHHSLVDSLASVISPEAGVLTPAQEEEISRILHDHLGIHASAELESNRLNRSYGIIGAEQHLPRFPGDTASQHQDYIRAGITPGRGAWGYFANSRGDLTPLLEQTEKYYVAVQTLYLPDWNTRLAYLRDWYKYRKMLVLNPENGKAIVAAVADSGPAAFTGKHFGGSPEVMAYLRRLDGAQRGPVLMFFVDDPQNQIPLGPLEYNLEKALPLHE